MNKHLWWSCMRQEHNLHITVYITSARWLLWIWISEIFLACFKSGKRFCNVIYLLSLPAISVLFSGSCAYLHCVDTHSGKRNQLCFTYLQTPCWRNQQWWTFFLHPPLPFQWGLMVYSGEKWYLSFTYPSTCLFIFWKSNNSPFNLEHSQVLTQIFLQNRPVSHVLFSLHRVIVGE